MLYIPNPQEPLDRLTNLTAAVQNLPLAVGGITVTPTGGSSTNFTYAVVADIGSDTVPVYASITTGAASLSASAYNTIAWNALQSPNTAPVTYSVYRTVGGATQGLIASGLTVNSLVDTGLVATTAVVPFNTTGSAPQKNVQSVTASGPITIASGIVFINGSGVDAMTLAVPIAGPASAGGQDGSTLTVYCNTAHAHTVTSPSNGINGSKHVITFGAAAGNYCDLFAYNGVWYVTNNLNGTLS